VWTAPFYELEQQLAVDLPGARAVFTTVAAGDMRDTADAVAERLGVGVARARQVHGNRVLSVTRAPSPAEEADAIVTTTPGLAATVLAADCVPVAVAGGGVVGAVHAGWRGLRDDVIAATVIRMRALMDDPGVALSAAIGPSAGGCCYEVGEDLHGVFKQRGEDFRNDRNLDLHAIAAHQLEAAGVTSVHDSGVCTICSDPELFYSHRRDHGQTGRSGALVWLT